MEFFNHFESKIKGIKGFMTVYHDAIQAMAYIAPVINTQIIPASCPHDTYVIGLEETKKHIGLIKKYFARLETDSKSE